MRTREFSGAAWIRPVHVVACLLCTAALAPPSTAESQVVTDARGDGPGLHVVFGAFAGQFDLHAGPQLDILGGRAGFGLGELVQLTGFYWHEVDFSEQDFLDDRAWGAEVQLNLNAGFGLTPFLTTGAARVRVDTLEEQTAAVVGGGLLIPLGPVALQVAARDYIFGVGGLSSTADDQGATHNWLFSAGVTATLGRDRARDPVVAAAPPAPAPAPVPAAAPAPGVRDTVVILADGAERTAVIRNYQSDQRIDVPLPLEGSITIRYGPEAPAGQAPVILGQAPGAPPAAATPEAQTLAPQQPPAAVPGVADPAVDRIVEQTVAALMPRLDAADARRYNQLRADLNQALAAQQGLIRELVRAEVSALAGGVPSPTVPPQAVTDPRLAPTAPPPAPTAPPAAATDDLTAAIARATARLDAARTEIARLEARPVQTAAPAEVTAPPAPPDARLRVAMADVAARHGALLSTTETDRGPGVVVAGGAFATGASVLTAAARPAVQELAGILAAAGDAVVFVHGHTDSVGGEANNQRLSEERAETVRTLLVQAGLDPGRVIAIGFGEGRPIATNATAAGRALNRRVEIVVGAWSAGSDGGAP